MADQPQISRNDFVKLVIAFIGTGGGIVSSACGEPDTGDSIERRRLEAEEARNGGGSSSTSSGGDNPNADAGGNTSSGGTSGTSGGTSGTSSGTSGTPAPVDAGVDAAPVVACKADLALSNNAGGGITAGHAHTLTIPLADFSSNMNKAYTIAGGHTHALTITAAQFTMLQAGQTVNLTAAMGGGDNHTHPVAVKCA